VSEVRLSADSRSEFGKGGARRTRRAGKIPAVIYGHGDDPRHVALPAREFTAAIRNGGANVLLTLDIEGAEQLVIPKAIQRHAIKGTFDHVDLLAVRLGEKVTIDVPIVITGTVAAGGVLEQEHSSLAVEAEATHLPTEFEIDITQVAIGGHITAGDVKLPTGSALITDPELVLLIVSELSTKATADDEAVAALAAAASAESAAASGE
jgi:large subunit ribosomal protein L25